MEYIWETILGRESDFFLKQAEVFCPYSEVIRADRLQTTEGGQSVLEYNSLFRYDNIFSNMLVLKQQQDQWADFFFDACSHLLIKMDAIEGLSRDEMKIRRYIEELRQGRYARCIQADYMALPDKKQYEIAAFLLRQDKVGESVLFYARAVTDLMGTGVVYKNTIEPHLLLVYLGMKMTQEMSLMWTILNYCFLPLTYEVRLFETEHFALIDEQQTLQYEKIELF